LALLASERHLVLVLDDLHWADQASVELVANLLHRRVDRTTLLVAYRPAQASRLLRHAVDAACERESCEEITLGPLSPEDASALLDGTPDADSIYRESGGNPFYLKQLARSTSGPPGDIETDLYGVPVTVMRALASELAELSGPTRLVVDAASVAGEPCDAELVSAIASVERAAVLDGLDDALKRGLMVTTAVPGRFEFRHPIVRRAVYASAPAAWLLGAHERAAGALEAAGARPSVLAHHVECSARQGDEAAVALLTTAGRETARVAPASAARWYGAALRLLPADAEVGRRLALLAPLAASLTAASQLIPAREVLEQMLRLLAPEQGAHCAHGHSSRSR
jgi:predicted ATPase